MKLLAIGVAGLLAGVQGINSSVLRMATTASPVTHSVRP